MTTPQSILYDIQYKLSCLLELLHGNCERDTASEESQDIYEMCKAIETESTEFNERMELLEDKMNLIIKLLSKDERK